MIYEIIDKETKQVVGTGSSNNLPEEDAFYIYKRKVYTEEEPLADISDLATNATTNIIVLERINSITVTVNGKVFQGNEQSQNRLANKISIMKALGETSTQWKLLDNSWVEVTIEELTEALKLASKAMEDILKEY